MQSVWILCICTCLCVRALAVEVDSTNALEKAAENVTPSDITNLETTDAARADSGNKGDKIPRETLEAAEDTKTSLGRTLAAWLGLNSIMEMRDGTSGKLNMILRELRQEKKRLLGQAAEPAKKKQEDSDEDEEEEEEEEEEAEEEEGGEEGGNGGEQEEQEEAEQAEENEAANNGTATRDLLPEGCLVEGGLISCKDTGVVDLPIITDLNITILELPGNNITTLPALALSGMPNLELVDLSRNLLDDSSLSPDFFMNLTLRSLNLDGNGLETIPFLPQSLEELRINDNKINQLLSHNFEGLSNLLVLELRGNILWEGSVEPLAFQPLSMLKHLNLDNNRFTSIPFGLPESLEVLRISQNQLVEVQDNVLNNSTHLAILDLSHNLLGENSFHPGAWINLLKLEYLDLSNNHLFEVPSDIPRGLRQLSLQHNFIQTIPPNVLSHLQPGLQSLNLSHNQLMEQGLLGKAFRGAYKTLEELILDNNGLERVPPNIRLFTKLHTLRLDHNRISSIPVKSVCKVANKNSPLLALHLENNYIDVNRIPRAALSCIHDPQRVKLEPQTLNEIY